MSMTSFDALIVGSGAAGAFAARELTAQGLSVLMLEAGPAVTAKDFTPGRPKPKHAINLWERTLATLGGQHMQSRALFFSRRLGHMFVNDRKSPYTTPKDAPFLWVRGQQQGGRTHVFGRVLMRWTDDDFKIASKAGRGLDWPFSYTDIEPYYREVERSLGLYGNEDKVSTMPDSDYVHPAYLTHQERMFRDIVEADRPEQRVVAWRFAPPEPDRLLTPLREAMASGLLTIRFGAIVKRVKTDAAGRATGVDYIDRQTRQVGTANAANVVLCASPIETVRLLLNSKSAEHGHGLGNSSGTLGRFFMDQLPNLAAGRFHPAKGWELDESQPKDDFYAPTGGIFLPRPETSIRERGEFAFQGSVGRAPVDSQNDPARFSFFGFGQMLPHEDNRITLDSRRTDSWRLPAAHIRCVMHDYEKQLLKRQEQTLQDMVERAGGEFEFIGSPLGLREMGRGGFPDADPFSRFIFRNMFHKSMCMGSAIHETGGAVMGADSRTSVLNTWGQSWDVPNLFVTDASAFPGSGVSGTTLTVMAQTVRACRRLAEEYRAGRL